MAANAFICAQLVAPRQSSAAGFGNTILYRIAVAFLFVFGIVALFSQTAHGTTFTTTVPGTSITLPTTYPQAGGVAIVLEGANGNVYYQFVNPSTMFQGYQNTGTPVAWQGNPFQIGPAMLLNCGPVVSCSTYLGGSITRMSVRFTAYDGDNQSGMFDFNDLNLRINGSNFGASSGNWSVVATQNTSTDGLTLISSNTGFGNNTFDTGWFQSTDSAILSNVLSTGSITATIFDRDPNDNFWDFQRGNDATTGVVPLNVAPGVTLDKASTTTSFSTVGQVIPYTFTYRNVGSVWINNVSISDPKVTGASCPAPPAAGTANLDPNEQVVCTANYTVTQADVDAGQIVNTATATGTPQAGALGPVTDSNTIPGPASAPGVDIVKTAAPSPFGAVGSTLTYSFAITNTGNVTLSNVSVTDPSLGSLSCSTSPIAPGVTVTATCTGNTRTITQANVDAGSIANTATVSARAPNSTIVTDTSSITTNGPTRTGGITLVKTAGAVTDLDSNGPDAGDTVLYSFLVNNSGNVTLTGIAVTDAMTGAVSCPTTTLAPAASTTCTATYSLTQANFDAGSVTNSASVTSSPPSGVAGPVTDTSGTAANNNTPTNKALTQSPAMSVDKTSPTASFNAVGNVISYSYLVRNTGNVTITNAITIADNKTTASCPANTAPGLAPNATLTCTATYTVTQADIDAGGVTNTATAATTFGAGNTVVTSAADQVTVPAVQNRALSVDKTATAVNFVNDGDTVSYAYLVTNTGNTTLTTAITVADNRVATVSCPSMPVGGLAPGASLTCTSTYSVTVADLDVGSVTNIATASSGATVSPQDSVTVPGSASPAMSIDKTSSASTFSTVGAVIPYNFLITNTGGSTFTRTITVNDNKIGAITCWVPPVSGPMADRIFTPGETLSCSGNYTVTQADLDLGSLTNQASVATTYGAANTPIASPPDSLTINATQNPSLDVTKSVATLPVTAVGQTLTYTISARNNGNVTLSNVTITDPLIPAMSCNVASLAVSASTNCSGTYSVSQADFNAGQVVNTATATASSPLGAGISDTGSNTVTITQNSSVSIAKSYVSNLDQDSSGTISLGDTLTYTVTVTNDGNISQSNVAVSDPMLTPSSATCATLLPGAACALTGTLNVTQAQVNAGTVSNSATVTTTLLPTPETATRNVAVPQTSTLSIDKPAPTNGDQDASGSITLNDVLTYTVTATNTGNVTQTGVTVSDAQLTPSSTVCASVAPGGTCVLTGTKTVSQAEVDAGAIFNTASVTSVLVTTPVTDSNTATVAQNSSVAIAKLLTANADEDSSGTISRNDTLTFTVTVTNDGTVTQSNVVVSDTRISPSSTTCASVAPASTCVLTGTYVVTQANVDAGTFSNTGSVTTTRLPTAETTTISTTVPQTRSLSLAKSSPTADYDSVGDSLNYSYILTNTGNVTLNAAPSVSDDKTSVICPTLPPGGLAPNATLTCSAIYYVTQADLDAGSVVNTATAQIGSTAAPADQATVNAVQNPQLAVEKTTSTVSFDAPGDVLTYNYVVRNTGNVTITNPVTVSDDKTTVVCNAVPPAGIAPNATLDCSATYVATQADVDAGGVTNTASAASTFGPSNGAVTSPDDQATVPAVQVDSLSVVKTATSVNFVSIGDAVTYDYVVTNNGNTTVTTPVTVTDSRVSPVNCPALPPGGLAPNATLTCTATYNIVVEDLDIGSVTNLATATDGTRTSPQVAETIPAGATPAITVTKTSPTTNFDQLGDVVTYNFVIQNSGNATFTRAISIVDDKIGTIACWTPTLADPTFVPAVGVIPAETVSCSANYAITQADLDRGFVTNQAYGSTTYGAANIPVQSPPDSVTVNAIQDPFLTVTKSAATLPVTAVGQVLAYTITAENTGDVTLSNVIISDPLIPSMSCTEPTLAVGTTTQCSGTYTVTQADIDTGQINNTATAGAVTPQGVAVSGTGTASTTMPAAAPALSMIKAARSPSYQNVGESVVYDFIVSNTGNVTLNNIIVTDPLVPSFSCTIATLSPLASNSSCSTSYVITQSDIDAGSLVNTAFANATAVRGSDPSTTATETVTGPLRQPQMLVSKSANPTLFAMPGNVINYSYVVSNTGNISFTGAITVSDDKLPSVSCPALPLGGLPPGGSITCTASYTVLQADIDAGSVTNVASAAGTSALGALTSAPDTVTINAGQTPLVSLVKSAAAISDLDANGPDQGDTIDYAFLVANDGNVTLTSVSVSDVKVGAVTCPSSSLLPGASMTCTATYTITVADVDAGEIVNTATASGTPPSGQAVTDTSGGTPGDDTPTTTTIARTPAIAIVKSAGPIVDGDGNGPDAGDTISYTFTISNEGNVTLTTVAMTDAKVGPVTCPVSTLAPGASTICSVTYTVTQSDVNDGSVVNSAIATATPPSGSSVSDASGTTTSDDTPTVSPISQSPAIALVKTASAITDLDANGPDAGDSIDYTFVVSNEGNVTLSSIAVTDPKVGAVTCPASVLAPGASTTCTRTYSLTQQDVDTGNVTNSATGSGRTPANVLISDTSGASIGDDIATVSPITQSPSLLVEKSSPTPSFDAVGDILTYAYIVHNTGNVTITSPVTITDDKAPVTCDPVPVGGLAPASTLNCTASYTVTQADIDAGSVVNTAAAASTFGPGNTPVSSPSDQVTVPAVQSPAMTVVKSAPPATLNFTSVGDTIQYEYLVTNSGNTTITDPIAVNDNRVTPVSCPALPPGGLAPGGTLNCTATYVVLLADLDLGSVTNLAEATDGNITSPQTSVTVPSGATQALTLSKSTLAPPFTAAGQVISYSYQVENTGTATLTRAISITDDRIGTFACWSPGGADVTLLPGEIASCSASYTVTQADMDSGEVTNQAFAATTYGGTNIPVTSAPESVTVNATQTPELTVTKSAATLPVTAVNQILTYTVRATNSGNVTVSSITVSDPLIPTLSCSIASLAPNAFADCTATYQVTQNDFDAGQIDNTATASGITPQGAGVSDTGNNSVVITQSPAVALVKAAGALVDVDGNGPDAGDTISYSFTASNEGNVTLTGIAISDPKIGAVSCPATTIAPGFDVICSATYTLTQADVDAGQVTNTAVATATPPGGGSVSDTSGGTINDDIATVASIASAPSLTIVKLAGPLVDVDSNGPDENDTISYTFTVANNGNQTLSGLGVTDAKVGPVSCPANTLLPGASMSCTATYSLTQADIDAGEVVNTATATGNAPGGASVSDISGSAANNDTPTTSTIPRSSSMSVIKRVGGISDTDGNGVDVGDIVNYTFEVYNSGNQTLSGITLTDAKATVAGGPLVSLAPLQTDTLTFTASYTLLQSDVDAGVVTNTATIAGNPPTGPPVTDVSGTAADNDTPTDAVLPSAATMTVVKTATGITDIDGNGPDVGDTINYTFDVENTGNVTLSNVTLNDPLVGMAALPGANATATLLALAVTGVDPVTTASVDKNDLPSPEEATTGLASGINALMGSDPQNVPEIQTGLHVERKLVRLNNATGPLLLGDKIGVYVTVTNTGLGALTSVNATQSAAEALGGALDLLPANTTDVLPIVFIHSLTAEELAKGTFKEQAVVTAQSRNVLVTVNLANVMSLADVKPAQELLTAAITPANYATLAPGANATFSGTYTLTQADVDAGQVLNSATGTAQTPSGGGTSDVSGTAPDNDTATTIAVPRAPAVALVKTAGAIADVDGNGPDAGDTITYTFEASNEGNVTLSALTISDAKVGTVTCPQTTIAPAASVTCTATYTLLQADVDQGSVVNTATAQVTAPDGATVNDVSGATIGDDTATTTLVPRTNALTLVKSAGAPTVAAGINAVVADADDTITYTFTLHNTGNTTLTPISVADAKVPAITCPVNTLAPQATTACTGIYTLTQADFDLGTVQNSALGSGTGPDGATTTDTSGTTETDDTPTDTTLPQQPALTLVKTAAAPTTAGGTDATIVDAGDIIAFSFEAVNAGNVTLTGLTISDAKVPGIVCPLTTLAPGASTICTGNYTITQADLDLGSVTNTALATANDPSGASIDDTSGTAADNDTPTTTTLPQVPLIAIVKTAAPVNDVDGNGVDEGDTLLYTFVVTNQGNVTLTTVGVTDSKLAPVSCPTTTLAPAQSTSCTGTYVLVQADIDRGQVENQATATGTPPVGPPVTDLSDPDTPGQGPGENDTTVTALTQTAAITLVKTADLSAMSSPAPLPGDVVNFVFTVRNTGNVTLTNISIVETLLGATVVGGPIVSLAPGQSNNVTISATYQITAADISNGFIENSARVTGNYEDRNLVAQTATDMSGTTETNDTPTRVPLLAVPRITLVKTATYNDILPPVGGNVGDTITYSFTVANVGNVTLNNIAVVDTMLTGVTCAATTLNVGQTTTCTAPDYVLTQADINAGSVSNQAVVNSTAIVSGVTTAVVDNSGTAGTNDDPTVITFPLPPPNLTKTVNKTTAKLGETVTYTIRATAVVVSPVDVVDILPGGLTFVPGTATFNGAAIAPLVSGRRLTFAGVAPAAGEVVITLQAVVNASAKDGKLTNRVQMFHPLTGVMLADARATLEIRPDPTFDCGDIIGKVFDDANHNGIQDAETSPYQAEQGLPGVRVVTVNGVLVTTDKKGRFHIPCADVPDAKIGSNFILKLDPRSLPSGYRLTTENPQIVRLTRGKMSKINFGAAISRVIRLDLTDKVFVRGSTSVSPALKAAVLQLVQKLGEEPSTVRLNYHIGTEGKAIAGRRLETIQTYIANAWNDQGSPYRLPIETRLLHELQKKAETSE